MSVKLYFEILGAQNYHRYLALSSVSHEKVLGFKHFWPLSKKPNSKSNSTLTQP
jgi:hypothetical protein